MTADDMEKMAEHDEHMSKWCFDRYNQRDGLTAVAWEILARQYAESARWWREQRGKADLR